MASQGPKTVLITGASAGIGYSTAVYLARRGYHVLATSRKLSRLDELISLAHTRSLSISAYQLDINDPSSVTEVVPRIIEDTGSLDALINNAGYILRGCLEDLTMEELKAQFETNLFAVLRMCQAVLPHMRERHTGTIVNVGSVAAHIVSPAGGAYGASKFALTGLTKALRMEVAQFGIRVVLVEPGLFRTKLFESQVTGRQALDSSSPYHIYNKRLRRNSSGNLRWAKNPEQVAKAISHALSARHPKPRYLVGLDAKLGALAAKFVPERLLEYLVKKVVAR